MNTAYSGILHCVVPCMCYICNFLFLRWQRETRIRTVAGRLQGEVAYFAPCGKKLRQYPDVMKVNLQCVTLFY